MSRRRLAGVAAAALFFAVPALAQQSDEEEYKVQLPDVAIYKAMLDANKTTGWVQFRTFSGKQLIYFTPLQTMHCRLSEIRYSINSDALDKRFPLGKCNPHIPFSIPETDTVDYVYTTFPAGSVQTIAVQAVWDDGAGSEIVIYKPCEGVGEATCAAIKTIKKPSRPTADPGATASPVDAVQGGTGGRITAGPSPAGTGRP